MRNNGDVLAKIVEAELKNVNAVDADDTSGQRFRHSKEALDDGGLSGAGSADDADLLPLFDDKVKVLENRRIGSVTERYVRKLNLTCVKGK